MVDLEPLFAPIGIDAFSGLTVIYLYMAICAAFSFVCAILQIMARESHLRWKMVLRLACILTLLLLLAFSQSATGAWPGFRAALGFATSLFVMMTGLGLAGVSAIWPIKRLLI